MNAHPPLLQLQGITKRFPGVLANDRIDLTVHAGEVHALLGENGAGKSTLVAILSGLTQPDAGRILLDGRAVVIRSPRHALDLGIGTVFQHSMLVPSLTVAENMALGAPWWQRPHRADRARRLRALAGELGISIDPDARVADLSLGEQQQVEILRALARGSRLVILDEATSMLTPDGIAELGALMRRMAARGIGILFITHKLDEAVAFGDRVTVLKRGRKVGEIPPDRMKRAETPGEIVEMMFGAGAGQDGEETPPPAPPPGELLRVEGLGCPGTDGTPALADIGFSVAPGEVFGIAGIDGNGQRQLAELLAGQILPATGRILLDGRDITRASVAERRALGLRYLTDDRLGEGVVADMPVSLNLLLKQVGERPFWRNGIEQRRPIATHAAERMHAFDIRAPGAGTGAGKLSGGNIQKLMLARELVEGARLVIFSKPGHGLDLANAKALHRRIRDLSRQGIGILLISTDLDEILALSHRIGVLSRGRLTGIVENGPVARAQVGRLMVGMAA
ncbi:MAG: ABC transporter ATP-binding protein [Alphaproteobacteria bacterium]|nr:MAG: ABC transporter ATP-binding protein [Alphaproteobacteria bacterium]